MNLKARHVLVDDVCEGCGDHLELMLHSLWLCDQARAVWMLDLVFQFLVQKGCRFFVEHLENLFREGSCLKVALFATICWCLWQRQNQVKVRQPSWQLHETKGRANMMVREFWGANEEEQQGSVRRPQARWSLPPTGTYKANINVTIFEELHCVGLGIVYQDHSGQVVVALSQRIGLPRMVEMVEALAVR